jgi:hypothetical protein
MQVMPLGTDAAMVDDSGQRGRYQGRDHGQRIQRLQRDRCAVSRLYHVVVIRERDGQVTRMTATPVTHAEGCTIMRKITRYPWRRVQLAEVTP